MTQHRAQGNRVKQDQRAALTLLHPITLAGTSGARESTAFVEQANHPIWHRASRATTSAPDQAADIQTTAPPSPEHRALTPPVPRASMAA
jgi:hypothetical protein